MAAKNREQSHSDENSNRGHPIYLVVDKLHSRLKRHRNAISRLELEADSIVNDFEDLLADCFADDGEVSSELSRIKFKRSALPDPVKEALKILAANGAGSLELKSNSDGSGFARIDEGREIPLSKKLFRLLTMLADVDNDESDGRFPAWRSKEEIRMKLSMLDGVPQADHAVVNSISRLRDAIWAGSANSELVQTSADGHYRFALRKK